MGFRGSVAQLNCERVVSLLRHCLHQKLLHQCGDQSFGERVNLSFICIDVITNIVVKYYLTWRKQGEVEYQWSKN